MFELLGLITLAWLFAPLVIGIPIVYFKVRQPASHDIKPAFASDVPQAEAAWANESKSQLEKLGLVQRGIYRHPGTTPQQHYIVVAFSDPEMVIRGNLNIICGPITHKYLEFSSVTQDEPPVHLTTYNAEIPGPLVYPENFEMHRHPQIQSTEQLYAQHKKHLTESGRANWATVMPESYSQRFNQAIHMILEHQVALGILKRLPDNYYGFRFAAACRATFCEWITFRHLQFWRFSR